MSEVIRVLIADDFPVVRTGLKVCIEERGGVAVVGEAQDGETALAMITDLKPHVAILDIDMPKMNGFQVIRAMNRLKLDTRVLFLSFHKDEDMFREAIEIGGKGYLIKDSAMQEILAAIESVMAGKLYVSSAVAVQLLQGKDSAEAEGSIIRDLTPSERRILRLISDGMSSKEIGAELSIHYRTVENHRTNICRKLNIEGANALLRFAVQHKNEFR